MKATKKLLLFAFVVTLMITMIAAFAITASAAEETNATIGFNNGNYDNQITYGEEYDLDALVGGMISPLQVTAGVLPGEISEPKYAFVSTTGNAYVAGDDVGKYFIILTSVKIGDETISFSYGIDELGNLSAISALSTGFKVRANSGPVAVVPKSLNVVVTGGAVAPREYDGTRNVYSSQVTGYTTSFEGLLAKDEGKVTATLAGLYDTKNVGIDKAVTLSATLSGDAAKNYVVKDVLTSTSYTADITVKVLKVVLDEGSKSKVYGSDDNLTKFHFEGAIEGETPAYTGELARADGKNVGKYAVNKNTLTLKDNGAFLASNYAINNDAGYYEITPATLTITVNASKDYDGTPFAYTIATTDVAGLKYSDSFENGTLTTSSKNAGTYSVAGTDFALSGLVITDETITKNYVVEYAVALTINKIDITVTYTSSKTYDGTTFSASLGGGFATGLVGGDTFSGILNTNEKNVGVYNFDACTFAYASDAIKENIEANYNITWNVTLTISKAYLTVTVNGTKEYDATPYVIDLAQDATATLYVPDTLTGTITTDFVNAGTHTTAGAWTTNIDDNYDVHWVVNVVITQKNVTVTVDFEKTYDGTSAKVTHETAGALTLENAIEGHYIAEATFETNGVNVGTYGPSAWVSTYVCIFVGGNDVTGNYNITCEGDIEITRAELTVNTVTIANPYYYGKTDLNLADVVITFKGNVETLTVGTDYSITSAAWVIADGKTRPQAGENKLVIEIAIVDNPLTSNYDFVANTDKIYEATGTNAAVKQCVVLVTKVYVAGYDRYYNGTKDFDESKVTGFLLTVSSNKGAIVDDLTVVLDENATNLVWSATSAGTEQAKLDRDVAELSDSKNYKWSGTGNATVQVATQKNGVDSKHPIRKANIYIVPWANQSKIYGAADPTFVYQYYVEGKSDKLDRTWDADVAKFTGVLKREAGDYVTTYKYITTDLGLADNGTFLASNYKIAGLVDDAATFEITKRNIIVTADNKAQIYFDDEVALTYKAVLDLQDLGTDELSLSTLDLYTLFTGALERESGNVEGAYAINQGTVALKASDPADLADPANNFNIVYKAGTYSIEKAIIRLVANDINVVYGTKPVYTFSVIVTNDSNPFHKINAGLDNITSLQAQAGITLNDGLTKLVFAPDFVVTYNEKANNNVGTYVISFYDAADVTIDETAPELGGKNSVVWDATKAENGTLTVTKKPIALAFENVTLYYGEALTVNVIAADGYALVAGDTFAEDFVIDLNKLYTYTTYMPGASVGTYYIYNNSDLAHVVQSMNYEIVDYTTYDPSDMTPWAHQMQIGEITVKKAPLYLVPYVGSEVPTTLEGLTNITKVYGEADPTINFTFIGLFDDEVAGITAYPVRNAGENVGVYDFNMTDVALLNNVDSGFLKANYELVLADVKFEITPATLVLNGTIDAGTQPYNGDVIFNGTIDLSGLGADLEFDGDVTFADKNVGNDKALSFVIATTNGNYVVDYSGLTIIADITPIEITISGITAEDKVYNANTNVVLNYTGVVFGGIIAGDELTVTADAAFENKNAGDDKKVLITNLVLGGADAANYVLAADQQTETTANIAKAPLQFGGITVNNKVYDGTDSATFVYPEQALNGLCPGDVVGFAIEGVFDDGPSVGNNKTITFTNVTLTGADADNYYIIDGSQTAADADITPATLKIIIDSKNTVYGEEAPEFTFSYEGFVNGEDASVITVGNIVCAYNTADAANRGAGEYVITAEGFSADNYTIVVETGTLTVAKATLNVTVNNEEVVYGSTAPVYGYTVDQTGYVYAEDTDAVILGTAVYGCTYEQNKGVATYDITLSGIYADNYDLVITSGTLTVTKKALTIKPVDTTITYGDVPTCDGHTLAGLTPHDAALTLEDILTAGALTFKYTYAQYDNIGTYEISIVENLVADNYEFFYETAVLTVEAFKLNGYVTLDGETTATIKYGNAAPAYAVVFDEASMAVINGAGATIDLVFAGYTVGYFVGEYAISATLDASVTNFVIKNITDAALTVAKRVITIKADDINVEYGDEPNYTVSFGGDGLAECDTEIINDKVFIAPTATHIVVNNKFTNNYKTTDAAGTTYLILMAGYTFESENYEVEALYDGKLTVIKRVIDVTLNNVDVIYGNDIDFTKFTYVIEEDRFVEGDDFATIFGVTVENLYNKITSNYVAGTVIADAGKVEFELSGVTADNYEINFKFEGATIAKREITLTIDDIDVIYGEASEGTFTLGEAFGTDVVDVTLAYGGYEKGVSNAGETFEITATTTNANYTLVFEAAELTVVKRAVTITVRDWRAMYGLEPSYNLTGVKFEGFYADQGVNYVITSPDYVVGNNVGNYTLTIKAEDITAKDGTLLSNYDITVVNGNLEIYKRTFIITVKDATIVYGDEANSNGYGYTEFAMPGMITEDVLAGITFKFNTKADGTGEDYKVGSPVGTYYIIAVYEANANYAVFASAGKLTVTPKNVTVTINDNTIEYKQPAADKGYVADGILAEDIAAFEAALKYTFGGYVCDAEKPEYSPAGTYVLSAVLENYEDAANYNVTFVNGTLTVTKIKITITATVTPITYGDAFEGDASVKVPEEFAALVTGAPVFTVPTYTVDNRGVGTYEVVVEGIELVDATNYYFEIVGNTLEVKKFNVTVTANNGTATYADAEAKLNGFVIAEVLPYGENIDANFSVTSAYEQGVTVAGTYAIKVVAAAELDNYNVTLVDGTLTVSKKVINFTVDNGYIVYGENEPEYKVTYDALYGDDEIGKDLVVKLDIDAKGYKVGSPISTPEGYEVTVSFVCGSEKYELNCISTPKLFVAKRVITINADNKEITYGQGYPEFTYNLGETELAPGEVMADLVTVEFAPTYTYDENHRDGAGTYDITIVLKGATEVCKNYEIYVKNATLTVLKKELTIIPENTVMLKGAEIPEIKYTYTGLVGNDTVEFYGALGTKATDVEGVLEITLGNLIVLSSNYELVIDKNSTATLRVLDVVIDNPMASVSLKADVIINYFFDIKTTGSLEFGKIGVLQWSEEEYKALAGYLYENNEKFELNGKHELVNNEYYKLSVNGRPISAKDYTKVYYARAFVEVLLEDGESYFVYSDILAYSVEAYGKTVLDSEYSYMFGDADKQITIAMLDYGAAAQKYFGDKSTLANAFITDAIRTDAGYTGYNEGMNPSNDKAGLVDGAAYNETLAWYGANASFGTRFAIYFHGVAINDAYVIDGDDANFGMIYWTEADLVDGKFLVEKAHNAEVKEGNQGYYVFNVEDIPASEGANRIYAAMWVADAEGNVSYSYVTYTSVKDYAYRMMGLTENANFDYIVELGEATIAYIEAAKAYFKD